MGRSEFVGQDNRDWDDNPDYFTPRTVQRQSPFPAMSIEVQGNYAKLVTSNPISYLSSEEIGTLIESLQEAKDFLDSH